MSEHPDVALVRRGYEAFSAGDMATLSQIIAADATQFQPGTGAVSGDHKGRDAILEFYGQLAAGTDGTFRVELERLHTDGQGRVVALHRATAQRQGRSLNTSASLIFTISNGMAVDIHGCQEDIDAWDAFWA